MKPGANPSDDEILQSCANDLAAAVRSAIGPWVERSVLDLVAAWSPQRVEELRYDAHCAGQLATVEIGASVEDLLATDVDEQRYGPLEVIRGAVRYPSEVLARVGVPPVVRDEFAERAFPEDIYNLTPGGFQDLSEEAHNAGLRWGAAKAHRVLARRRAEGLR